MQRSLCLGGHSASAGRPPCRLSLLAVIWLFALSFPGLSASKAETAPDDAELDRLILGLDEAAATAPRHQWLQQLALGTSGGWRDNVLLTERATYASAYLLTSLDWSVFVLPTDGRWSAYAVVQGEHEHFLEHRDTLADQYFVIGLLGFDYRVNPAWKTGLRVETVASDQVLGIAVSDFQTDAFQIAGLRHGITANIEWRPRERWRVSLAPTATRETYDLDGEDYTEAGGGITLHYEPGRTKLALSTSLARRDYDERLVRTEFGFPDYGSELDWTIHETAFTARHAFDADEIWQARLRVSHRRIRDGEWGYDDHDRWAVAPALAYASERWDAELSAGWAHTDYPVQPVSLNDLTRREYRSRHVSLRVARKLTVAWSVVGLLRHEEVRANRPGDAYRATRMELGLSWLFESAP